MHNIVFFLHLLYAKYVYAYAEQYISDMPSRIQNIDSHLQPLCTTQSINIFIQGGGILYPPPTTEFADKQYQVSCTYTYTYFAIYLTFFLVKKR